MIIHSRRFHMEAKEIGETLESGITTALSNKPMWMFWAVYTVMSGVLFGVFYTAMYLLALKWWLAVIVIIATGLVWGTIVYTKESKLDKKGKKI
jgi:VIT1/CCC1 family predicted Fe2+/Mn2+ transporter